MQEKQIKAGIARERKGLNEHVAHAGDEWKRDLDVCLTAHKARQEGVDEDLIGQFLLELAYPGTFLTFRGAAKLYNRDTEGWNDLRNGALLALTQLNLYKCYAVRAPKRCYEDIYWAMALYCVDEGKAFDHYATIIREHPGVLRIGPNHHSIWLLPFIHERDPEHSVSTKTELSKDQLGPYYDLLKAWDSDKDLHDAIVQCCDYHIQSHKRPYDVYRDSGFIPFKFLPIEVMALKKLAKRVGKPWPDTGHPLLAFEFPPPPNGPFQSLHPIIDVLDEYMYLDVDLGSKSESDHKPESEEVIEKAKPTIEDFDDAMDSPGMDKVEEFIAESDAPIVMDWSDREEFLLQFVDQLHGKLDVEIEDDHVKLTFEDKSRKVKTTDPNLAQINLLMALDKLIAPDFQFRVFKATLDDDTLVFLLQPIEWWQEMESLYSSKMRKVFRRVTKKVLIGD